MKFQNLSVKRLFGRVAMELVLSMSGITIALFLVTKQIAVLLTGGVPHGAPGGGRIRNPAAERGEILSGYGLLLGLEELTEWPSVNTNSSPPL